MGAGRAVYENGVVQIPPPDSGEVTGDRFVVVAGLELTFPVPQVDALVPNSHHARVREAADDHIEIVLFTESAAVIPDLPDQAFGDSACSDDENMHSPP